MTNEMIRNEMLRLKGKNIILFFKYPSIAYNIKKSGKLLDCDDRFFIVEEVKDGRATYSFDNLVSVQEEKK